MSNWFINGKTQFVDCTGGSLLIKFHIENYNLETILDGFNESFNFAYIL